MGALDFILQLDTRLFLALNGLNSPWWDTAMLFFTRKESWLIFYLALIFVYIRRYGWKSWLIILFLLAGIFVSDQLSTLLKETVQRLRPGHEPAIEGLVHIVLRPGGLHGFVSSHASNTFFVLVFTLFLFRNKTAFSTILFWALLISYSRIYNGNHYPLDILGGWILGAVLGYGFFKLLMFIESRL
ncbi:MAG: phosphatase PAP2 family protein, partial [Prolixibacteraceae bacterium]|nr:phosphatase PAP2 family protein [Prolixibacteraceae bacterium]